VVKSPLVGAVAVTFKLDADGGKYAARRLQWWLVGGAQVRRAGTVAVAWHRKKDCPAWKPWVKAAPSKFK